MVEETARRRVVIEGVEPEVNCGRFPIKRVVGERVVVEADAFTDGHDALACQLLWRPERVERWSETAMKALPNDRWRGEFTVSEVGRYVYTLLGWVDPFKTWRRDLRKRVEAGQEVTVDLLVGAALIEAAGERAAAGARRGAGRAHGPPRRPLLRHPLRPRAGSRRRSPAGALQRLVRALPA